MSLYRRRNECSGALLYRPNYETISNGEHAINAARGAQTLNSALIVAVANHISTNVLPLLTMKTTTVTERRR